MKLGYKHFYVQSFNVAPPRWERGLKYIPVWGVNLLPGRAPARGANQKHTDIFCSFTSKFASKAENLSLCTWDKYWQRDNIQDSEEVIPHLIAAAPH